MLSFIGSIEIPAKCCFTGEPVKFSLLNEDEINEEYELVNAEYDAVKATQESLMGKL